MRYRLPPTNRNRQKAKLEKHGLSHRRKILFAGPPGTEKTLTAAVLAGELGLPLFTIMMDKIVTKFMGETNANLRDILWSNATGLYVDQSEMRNRRIKHGDIVEGKTCIPSDSSLMDAAFCIGMTEA